MVIPAKKKENRLTRVVFTVLIGVSPLCQADNAPNTIWLMNRGSHQVVLDEMVSQNNQLVKVNSILLWPGQSAAMGFWPGQSGFVAAENSSGQLQWNASRFEFYGGGDTNSVDVSYIDGRNASITVDDGRGHKKGDLNPIAGSAPSVALSYDQAGWPTITGWYDGSTDAMREGGAYIQSKIACGSSYIHPTDDQNPDPNCNPMTEAQDPSKNYYVDFGDP